MIPDIQLAPMEGVFDGVLRELISEIGGVDRMVTEFVRVTDRLLPAHVFHRYCPELAQGGRTRAGTPVFIQLLGGQPEWVAENARVASELGTPGIDLNFGCPAKTVNRHDGGAALLQHPERVMRVIRAVRAAVPLDKPVTAKVRLGFAHKDFHREIATAAAEGGASHLVVHARTKLEMYQPPAHWSYVARMQEGLSLPVLANGDIWDQEDFRRCQHEAQTKRVALGRGLVRRPYLARLLRSQDYEFAPLDFLTRFFEINRAQTGDAFALGRLKQILRYWSAADSASALWFTRAKVLTSALAAAEFLTELRRHHPRLVKENQCLKYKSTPGPIAPTVFAPKIS